VAKVSELPDQTPDAGGGPKPRKAREARGAQKREVILNAALEEFSARGFAATRLEDVAKRAGVAKGTIYLYFADKETLFQELVRSMLSPMLGHLEHFAAADLRFADILDRLVDVFVSEILETRRKDIIRLIVSEGPRFPALTDFYYREVPAKVFGALRGLMQQAYDRGELRHKALVDFPQLLGAPLLLAIIWNALFAQQAPLESRAMLRAYLDILLDRGHA
jgi:AcrR family transcriptional regulator